MRDIFPIQGTSLGAMLWLAACTPGVELAAPKEPITINLNVKIEHEVRVKGEKDSEGVLSMAHRRNRGVTEAGFAVNGLPSGLTAVVCSRPTGRQPPLAAKSS